MTETDPTGRAPTDLGAKLDAGKPIAGELILAFPRALADVIDVSTAGARKYSRQGFLSVPNAQVRYLDAAMRHLLAYGMGQERDADTGCKHLAQACWNLLAILEIDQRTAGAQSEPADVSPQHETGGDSGAGKPAVHLTREVKG